MQKQFDFDESLTYSQKFREAATNESAQPLPLRHTLEPEQPSKLHAPLRGLDVARIPKGFNPSAQRLIAPATYPGSMDQLINRNSERVASSNSP
jgi:hypothetical protein